MPVKNKPTSPLPPVFPVFRSVPTAGSLVFCAGLAGLVAAGFLCPSASAQQPAASGVATPALPEVSALLSLPQSGVVHLTPTGSRGPVATGAPAALPALPAVKLGFDSADLFSPTNLSIKPELATVTLTYDLACVGAKVVVAPLDGGVINGTPGGQTLQVGLDGTVLFSFQAPAGPGRYHVVTRLVTSLGSRERALPFDVIDPAAPQPLPLSPTDG